MYIGQLGWGSRSEKKRMLTTEVHAACEANVCLLVQWREA